jgi:hypothetical protein
VDSDEEAGMVTLRRLSTADPIADLPPGERYGPYIDAPVWPWLAAGWIAVALFVVTFVLAAAFA